jgi:hypothetical protein
MNTKSKMQKARTLQLKEKEVLKGKRSLIVLTLSIHFTDQDAIAQVEQVVCLKSHN